MQFNVSGSRPFFSSLLNASIDGPTRSKNYFCRIKDWRRIAMRYDKLARNYLAAAVLVGALYRIKL